jgi:hypothetical protein
MFKNWHFLSSTIAKNPQKANEAFKMRYRTGKERLRFLLSVDLAPFSPSRFIS